MAYGLFIDTTSCYIGINDPSKDTTLKNCLLCQR